MQTMEAPHTSKINKYLALIPFYGAYNLQSRSDIDLNENAIYAGEFLRNLEFGLHFFGLIGYAVLASEIGYAPATALCLGLYCIARVSMANLAYHFERTDRN